MNVYVWHQIERASDSYHTEGGVVVFADSEERARTLANDREGCHISESEKPDEVRACSNGNERVFIMPNAGCC